MSSCSSAHGRKLTIKKRRWSSSKLQTLTREVWSSPRPSKGNGEPFTSSSETRRTEYKLLLAREDSFFREESSLPLGGGRDPPTREDRAPLASKQESLLLHPRLEKTESFLHSHETEERAHSQKGQTSPSKISGKKRAPFTPQSTRRDLLLSHDYPLSSLPLQKVKRAYAQEERVEPFKEGGLALP